MGIGGCSTCYKAWDLAQGQLMCVKQVQYYSLQVISLLRVMVFISLVYCAGFIPKKCRE